MGDTVRVNMRGTVYYAEQRGQAKKRYGPGQGIEIPAKLAIALGLTPIHEATEAQLQAGTEPAATGTEGVPQGGQQGNEQTSARELESVDGIGPELAAALDEQGIKTLADFRAASDEQLLAVPGIGKATLAKLREATKE